MQHQILFNPKVVKREELKKVVLVGAGCSNIAGLPLSNEIPALIENFKFGDFRNIYREHQSISLKRINDRYKKDKGSEFNFEEYLEHIYNTDLNFFKEFVKVFGFILVHKSIENKSWFAPRHDIFSILNTKTKECDYKEFWKNFVNRNNNFSIITTNYDILLERFFLRMGNGFKYSDKSDSLKGKSFPAVGQLAKYGRIMEGNTKILKLHGSLNWSTENGVFAKYIDCRPAFRSDKTPAILAPIKRKNSLEKNKELKKIWKIAKEDIKKADELFVFGYSFPNYDIQIKELILNFRDNKHIYVYDKKYKDVSEKLKKYNRTWNIKEYI